MIEKKIVYNILNTLFVFNLSYIFILALVNTQILGAGRYSLVYVILFNTIFLKIQESEIKILFSENSLTFKKVITIIVIGSVMTSLELVYLIYLLKNLNF